MKTIILNGKYVLQNDNPLFGKAWESRENNRELGDCRMIDEILCYVWMVERHRFRKDTVHWKTVLDREIWKVK